MKVTLNSFRQAVANFEARIIDTFKDGTNRFAIASALAASGGAVESMVAPYVDADGNIDTDVLKAVVNAGMDACEGRLTIKPEIPHLLRVAGVSIDEIRIERADVEQLFRDMEGK